MKRLVFISLTFLIVLSACQETGQYVKTPGNLEVVVEDGAEFPEFLVGKWEADKDGWAFIFEPDGKIFVARISMGRTEIVPGKVKILPTHGGGQATYVPGDWSVIYSPAYRELTVDLVMNFVRVEMGDQALQGKERNIISGTVSEDGKLWRTVVSNFPEYEGFPNRPEDLPYLREVNFVKVEEK
ncbi:MAG TPA: hypothetical protein HPP87_11415 [Planctomycetes bacterium]|nr:hypothetical protein [Planctomycetota bacterium]